ncbi:carbohydrate ABC transporter permease [Thermomonospora cellulosilytica]|uniref:Cellobiose transport system permease protein n=1 Tax=Thermomonospora cellulosilytica TaxID=1411118 RepID=A0A7W3MTJ0_9ACTN|nr:carbohydrate ABC transporter permease [Thermomonospora cellulosilytica]MBA9001599.1 cellobiose transport system permease protein [Thermomonospora cellulosilytica]
MIVINSRRPRRRRGGTLATLWGAGPLTRITLAATIVLSVFPLYWMLVVATRTNDVVGSVPPPVVPGGELGRNLARLFGDEQARFGLGLVNSAVAASAVTVSTLLFASLAGFAFAKLRFRGRNGLLLVMLATMMVPVQMGIIPLYMLMAEIGWTGKLQAVIVPFLVTGFGVFMMRQYTMQALPDELIEAARIDGCSTWRIYWSVVLPVLRPAMAVLGLFTFMQTWNEFIWPLAVLDPDNPTVQYSLNLLNGSYYTDYSLMFTGTAVSTLPLLVIFLLCGRQLIGGIMDGALKA